ncbi:NADP-dependent oxidoreductase domain-containing protein [Aspergillus undulatus]|uniref:NADP-dependent oxidoreductase domain-containing protein n=1 Tax=Aspergillus undulatus TaxID=1810928 RepID=UPI003CCD9D3B
MLRKSLSVSKAGIVDMRTFTVHSSPAAVQRSVDRASAILAGTKIDLYGPARVDPNTPIEDTVRHTVRALKVLVAECEISGIQLSEASAQTIRRVHGVAKTDMVEAEISPWATDVFKNGVGDTCDELGIVLGAHTPLGTGMLTGKIKSLDDMDPNDYHRLFPRFQPENFATNIKLAEKVQKLAQAKVVMCMGVLGTEGYVTSLSA